MLSEGGGHRHGATIDEKVGLLPSQRRHVAHPEPRWVRCLREELDLERFPNEEKEGRGRCTLASALLTLYVVLTTAATMVVLRVSGRVAPNHAFFFSLSWAVGYIPVFLLLWLALFMCRRCSGKKTPTANHLPASPRRISRMNRCGLGTPVVRQSAYVGLLFAINFLGISTSNPHLSGPFQAVLSQIGVPLSLMFTWVLLRRKFPWNAWLGALLVFIGVILPSIIDQSSSRGDAVWILLFILGNVPLGLLPTNMEALHRSRSQHDGSRVNVEWRMVLTNCFISLWLLVFLPFFLLLGQPDFEDFSSNMRAAFSCAFTGSGGLTGSGMSDTCHVMGPVLLGTIVVAALQQHASVVLSRQRTGVFANLAVAVAPFLADAIFPIHAIMGDYTIADGSTCCTEDPSKWDLLGAALALVGVVIYVLAESRVLSNLGHGDYYKTVFRCCLDPNHDLEQRAEQLQDEEQYEGQHHSAVGVAYGDPVTDGDSSVHSVSS